MINCWERYLRELMSERFGEDDETCYQVDSDLTSEGIEEECLRENRSMSVCSVYLQRRTRGAQEKGRLGLTPIS